MILKLTITEMLDILAGKRKGLSEIDVVLDGKNYSLCIPEIVKQLAANFEGWVPGEKIYRCTGCGHQCLQCGRSK